MVHQDMKKHMGLALVLVIGILLLSLALLVQEPDIPQALEQGGVVKEVIEDIQPTLEQDVHPQPAEETPEADALGFQWEITITIKDLQFDPKEIIVPRNTKVTWVNEDRVPHTIVEHKRRFYGPRMGNGDTYSVVLEEVGTYTYFSAAFPNFGSASITVQDEPLPVTGNVVATKLQFNEDSAKFAGLIVIFGLLGVLISVHLHKKKYH